MTVSTTISVIPAKVGNHTLSTDVAAHRRDSSIVNKADSRLRGSGGVWRFVCTLDELPVLGARVIERSEADGGNVAVFRNDKDVVFALLDKCPHKGGPLSQGIVFGERVACPLHNWTIELKSGDALAPDVGCTQRFPVKVEFGDVFIDLV
jgi:nitrite reductase (NADH) small subunit